MSKLTPMMQQYMKIKEQNKDALLFFRLGDFYEMFFHDAEVASRELDIALTARDCGLPERAPMCGVPYHAAEGYIARLIERGYKVAICEQLEDPAEAKGIVKRDVVRIITPGTLLEASMLDERNNNYILSIYRGKSGFGLSWADISTGEFYLTQMPHQKELGNMIDLISGIVPSEVIVQEGLESDALPLEIIQTRYPFIVTPLSQWAFEYNTAYQKLIVHFDVHSLNGFGCEHMPKGISAAGALLEYLSQTQKNALKQITSLRPHHTGSAMVLDSATRINLELTETIRSKTKKGSLLWLLDKTITAMGGRLIRQWIQQPLTDSHLINQRLDAVGELCADPVSMEDLRHHLRMIYDLERLMGRVSYGSANARDLISLKQSVAVLPMIEDIVKGFQSDIFKGFHEGFDLLQDIHILIEDSIDNNPPITIREGSLIKDGYNGQLDLYREAMTKGKDWLADLEKDERKRTGINTLRVGFNKVFGYYLEVTKSYFDLVPDNYIRKQTLVNSERYITPELKEVEDSILGAEEKSVILEHKLFVDIREKIAAQVKRVQETARIISILDGLWSLARVSLENRYIRPQVDDGDVIDIQDGRHPVVEKTLPNALFVPNHTYLDSSENQIAIITGPNMAGKSTYMRQVAVIVLMAQIGSFVPASKSRIGVVDRIFTRVGASDDLSAGQSTFMVEMNEMANILHNATPKSLLILDEIGRGTSTYDGLSIAWAIVEYICNHKRLGSKTLFATHYHELTELEGKLRGVKNFCITVKEQGNDIIFLRKVVRGGAEKSLGIQVARLAGLPLPVINRASKILNRLEKLDVNRAEDKSPLKEDTPQLSFFDQRPSEIEEEVRGIDILNITPIEALNILNKLVEMTRGSEDV
ncbi:MAG TPA: DNA mismatch repair protein MutS [Clostridia bacterium]|nr:DNA mismatch repair protein MutS [Clostridia bacterium]